MLSPENIDLTVFEDGVEFRYTREGWDCTQGSLNGEGRFTVLNGFHAVNRDNESCAVFLGLLKKLSIETRLTPDVDATKNSTISWARQELGRNAREVLTGKKRFIQEEY